MCIGNLLLRYQKETSLLIFFTLEELLWLAVATVIFPHLDIRSIINSQAPTSILRISFLWLCSSVERARSIRIIEFEHTVGLTFRRVHHVPPHLGNFPPLGQEKIKL